MVEFTKVLVDATEGQRLEGLSQMRNLSQPSQGVTVESENELQCTDGSRSYYRRETSTTFDTTTEVGYYASGGVQLVVSQRTIPPSQPAPTPKYSGFMDCWGQVGFFRCLGEYFTPYRVELPSQAIQLEPTCDLSNTEAEVSFRETVWVKVGGQQVNVYNRRDEGESFVSQTDGAWPYDAASERELATVMAGDVDNDGDIDVLLKYANGAYELYRQDSPSP